MGIPLESAKSSSDNNFDEPRLPNTAGKARKSKSSLTAKQSQKKSGRLASDSIGHFLEHSRIFWFCNNEDNEVFIGSADWMRRNLDRRIEAVTPIEDYELKSKIYTLLQTYIKDNYFSWIMKNDGSYSKYKLDSSDNRSQIDLIKK